MQGLQLSENDTFDTLASLADTICERLGGAVTIEDAGNRLLAYSSHELQTDPARLATIIKRRVPDQVISSLWRSGMMQRLQQSDEPLCISGIEEVGLGSRVAIAIRKNEEVLGYIWIKVDRPLDEDAMGWLKQVAESLRSKLPHARKSPLTVDRQAFLWQLLTGHYKSHAQIVEQARSLQVPLSSALTVAVWEFPDADLEKMLKQLPIGNADERFAVVGHTADRNQLIMLLSASEREKDSREIAGFAEEWIRRADDRLSAKNVICGLGSCVRDDYTRLEASYQEALAVLQIKKQYPEDTRSICQYQELGFYQYLPEIAKVRKVKKIENPHIAKLRAYDLRHQTELVRTLGVYLSCDSNVKEAAKSLHIHINTLMYRLARMTEITDLNLRDMNQKVTLYLDLRTESNEWA